MTEAGYPGSKAGAGVWQRIISQMPAHDHYFELFLGHGAVMRAKRPAPHLNVGVDEDAGVIRWWKSRQLASPKRTILQEDALRIPSLFPAMMDPKTLVYLDPPYLGSTRTRLFYRREFHTNEQHCRLLKMILDLKCMVMISGYGSPLYRSALRSWRRDDYRTMTRGGPRVESLWMNFPAGLPLHDCRFVGGCFRKRELIKKKRNRWASRFAAMPADERQVIREALESIEHRH